MLWTFRQTHIIYRKYKIKLATFDHEVHKVLALLVDKGALFDVALHLGACWCWARRENWRVSGRRKDPFEWEDRLVPAPFLYPNA